MNFVLFGSCWIASATVFGVLFSYSPWELTPATSTLALSAGLLVAVVPLLRRQARNPFQIAKPASVIAVLLSVIFLRSEEHTSELQSLRHLVCRLLLEKKKKKQSI